MRDLGGDASNPQNKNVTLKINIIDDEGKPKATHTHTNISSNDIFFRWQLEDKIIELCTATNPGLRMVILARIIISGVPGIIDYLDWTHVIDRYPQFDIDVIDVTGSRPDIEARVGERKAKLDAVAGGKTFREMDVVDLARIEWEVGQGKKWVEEGKDYKKIALETMFLALKMGCVGQQGVVDNFWLAQQRYESEMKREGKKAEGGDQKKGKGEN